MVNSHEDKMKNTSRRSGSSRASRKSRHSSSSSRKSGSSKSRSPNRSEPRRTKRSKEDLEAKEKARAERDISGNYKEDAAELAAVDHTGVVENVGRSNSRNKPRKSNRRSQQDRGISKDAYAKAKGILNRSNEPITGPTPGVMFADSRGDDEVLKTVAERGGSVDKTDAAKLTASVNHTGAVLLERVEEDRTSNSRNKQRKSNRRSQQDRGIAKDATAKVNDLLNRSNEANAGPCPGAHADSRGDEVAKDQKSGKGRFNRPLGTQSVFAVEELARMEAEKGQEHSGLLVANAVDDNHDANAARDLLNSMLDQSTKNTTKKPDSSEESKEEENEESDATDWENSKLKKGVQFFRFLCCIIVLGAAGIGTWIALRENNNLTSDTMKPASGGVPNVTTDTDTPSKNTTDSNFSTISPSPNATSAPSGPPNSNTVDNITFEPPSEEDCAAIANGGEIEGQDTMSIQSYLLDLDVTPSLPIDLSTSAGVIEKKLRDLLTPALTGCDRDVRKLRQPHRHLVDEFSYAIGNVMVEAFGVEGVPCLNNPNPQCHRISATLNIVVKVESVKVSAVITQLSLFLGGAALVNKLELAELYQSMQVANLGSIDQTKSPSIPGTPPSMEPSKAPSAVSSPPTLVETPMLTASPTRGPSASVSTPLPTSKPAPQETTPSPTTTSLPPTPGPTPPPTPQPNPQGTPPTSLPPTIRPITEFPTPRPTAFPTPRPVAQPTFSPTVADPTPPPSTLPSEMPSTSPTNAPVVESQFPSESPTEAPSANPSITPSSSPSSDPSRTPSSQPSPNPTSGPTIEPSRSPSYRPSAAPFSAPSPAPAPISLSTNRCAYLESVLGNRASLHQLAFDWMCNVDTWEPSQGESYPEQWHDRYAVVAFYYALNNDDPNTFNYSRLSGASTQSTCSWLAGRQSSGSIPDTCHQTAVGSKVKLLRGIYASNISGSRSSSGYIPSAIGLLTNLDQLWAARIHRQLPSEIGLLKKLRLLTLDQENVYSELGTIPTEIGLLTDMIYMYGLISGLTGTIPSELMNLTKLTRLIFTYSRLTGTIPSAIIELTDLEYLNFLSNKLTGTIPPLPIVRTLCNFQLNFLTDVTNGVSAGCDI